MRGTVVSQDGMQLPEELKADRSSVARSAGVGWRKGEPREALDRDFELMELGRVITYGAYVLNKTRRSSNWVSAMIQQKAEIVAFAQKTDMEVLGAHFPPGTSKYNRIEHRLSGCINRNWPESGL